MSISKPLVLGLALVAGLAVSAQAQTVSQAPVAGPSVASLPPDGPRASSENYIPSPHQLPATASGQYIGPAPGAGTGQMPPRYQKPADWDQNVSLHPYSSSMGPKPN